MHTRAPILLLTDYSQDQHRIDADIAENLQIPHSTVVRVHKRYLYKGLDAVLQDKPHPGQPPKITGEAEAHLTVLACSEPADGHDHWTLRLLGIASSNSGTRTAARIPPLATGKKTAHALADENLVHRHPFR